MGAVHLHTTEHTIKYIERIQHAPFNIYIMYKIEMKAKTEQRPCIQLIISGYPYIVTRIITQPYIITTLFSLFFDYCLLRKE